MCFSWEVQQNSTEQHYIRTTRTTNFVERSKTKPGQRQKKKKQKKPKKGNRGAENIHDTTYGIRQLIRLP